MSATIINVQQQSEVTRNASGTSPPTNKRVVYNVTPEQFVTTWQMAEGVTEVTQKLKMPQCAVHARACFYRERGIPLKKFRRGRHLDVHGLASLARDLENPEVSRYIEHGYTPAQAKYLAEHPSEAAMAVVEGTP